MSSPLSLTALYEAPAGPTARTEDGAVRCVSLAARAYAAVDEVPDRIESGVSELAEALGFRADCNATGTGIVLTISQGARQWTEVIRVHLPGPDFARAVALYRLLARIRGGELTPDEGADRLEQLLAWRDKAAAWKTVLATALLSASAALLLRSPWPELLLAMGIGAVVGAALAATEKRPHLDPLVPVVLAGCAAAAAFSADNIGLEGIRPVRLLIASLVILLPGWRLTVAMSELATGHWTSGAGRFLAAITTLLLLIVGVVVGRQAVQASDRFVLSTVGTIPVWVRLLSPVVAGIAMTHLFRSRRRDGVFIVLVCVVTSTASWLGGQWLGSTASAFLGAFTAMAFGALVARARNLPYPVLQQPATVLLVPGSMGFLSMTSIVQQNVTSAVQTGFQMLFVALTLALGAMTAQVALRPLTDRRRS